MILFFTNPNLGATAAITSYGLNAGAEYALGVLKTEFDFDQLTSTDKKFNYTVEHQFPSWLVSEARKNNSVNTINLIQRYYDWVFSTSGLDLYPNYEDIQNVFYMNFDSLKETYKSLFSDFDFDDFGQDYETELREFLVSNKKRFIVNKGNQDSFKYFIQTFFNSVLDDYEMTYGVDNTLVLNQGTLNGDYMTEGANRQEFGIILTAYIPEKYQDDFISMMKPIGFRFDLVKGQRSLSVTETTSADRYRPSSLIE
jgi:hypothetical protein